MTNYMGELPIVEWRPNVPLVQYKNFWLFHGMVQSLSIIENQYKPRSTDVLIASYPKAGTTWLKALTFSILHHEASNDLLETHNPHQLVPFLEGETFGANPSKKINDITSPRLFSTHLPYSILPENVKNSACKIVYVSRNPADTFISSWHFFNKFSKPTPLEDAFNEFVSGVVPTGPFFDHVLGYWQEREKENVLFLTYEELKKDPKKTVKQMADFMGFSLSDNEIEQVVRKSSFERLSKLEINSGGKRMDWGWIDGIHLSSFFRIGTVGDGNKCLTREMMTRLFDIAHHKWGGSGLETRLLFAVPPK